jgi:Lhr-like helicase
LAELIEAHRTTLIFVNTRRMAERVTRKLSDILGETRVTAHHGSLAKEQRLDAEQRLKAGALKALVATASLELGIDIGDVDLVCQLGSPHAIATFLQRVGRPAMRSAARPRAGCFRCHAMSWSSAPRCSIAYGAASSIGWRSSSSRRCARPADRRRGGGAGMGRG